ncbi:hypothetical protein PVAG01_04493 [Phlyctema vagabunda]|uniref:Methyltransferase type 11 domain-containing protein n=1 Tax=Phlyctema vagabunda TaxID=108571 RepID=A0ABR4PQ27_9HELO
MLGTYTSVSSRPDGKEGEMASVPRRTDNRKLSSSRPPQAGLPKPSSRAPSPATRPTTEAKPAASRFGFGKPKPATTATPEVKGRSSRNVLRRKPSSIAAKPTNERPPPLPRAGSSSPTKWSEPSSDNYQSIASSLKSAEAYYEVFTRTAIVHPSEEPRVIPELDRYRIRPENNGPTNKFQAEVPHKISTQDLPPATGQYSATPVYSALSLNHNRLSGYSGSGYSASPSTRFSESPGPGAYSRDTTPTSMSSQSPSIAASLKPHTPRLWQNSPATNRPPVSRRRTSSTANEAEVPILDQQGLPALRESLNSSSSNSTVRDNVKAKEKQKKRLAPQPPSPPPRKSSQKYIKPHASEQESPSKTSRNPVTPIMTTTPELSPKVQAQPIKNQVGTPPIRPSRDGIPDLHSQIDGSRTVIQSNLMGIGLQQEKRRSTMPAIGSQGQFPVPGQRSQMSSRNPSPSPTQHYHREPTPGPTGLGIVPDLRPQNKSATSRGRTPSPSVTNNKTRFGLFGRRTKTANDIPQVEGKEKQTRRGPVAGTGHEGYGRYAARGRSSSAGGMGLPRDRSLSVSRTSGESSSTTRTVDPFLLERMSPVIIAGGGEILENQNDITQLSRTESNTSLARERPSIDSKGTTSQPVLTHEASRTTLWPSAIPKEASRRVSGIAPRVRRISDTSGDATKKPSLAFRRSIQRLNNSTGALPLNMPKSLNTAGVTSPSISSLDTSIISDESLLEARAEMERGRRAAGPRKLAKRPKSPEKPKKWNFFHRSQKTPVLEAPVQQSMKVVVNKAAPKAVPHYALLDSSDDQIEAEGIDLEDILRDAQVVDLSNGELDAIQFDNYKANIQRLEEVKVERPPELAHLASVPIKTSSAQPISIPLPEMDIQATTEAAPPRPSRLPQVGRIPNVVRARPEQTSPKSFSRPFARISMLQPPQGLAIMDAQSVALGASPPKFSTPEPTYPLPNPETGRNRGSGDYRDLTCTTDFLAFSPRKNSSTTTSSSSGGINFLETIAVVPEADAELQEDEVWNEYDDLIERGDTPKVPQSATSSHGVPFQYESYESRAVKRIIEPAKESPTLNTTPIVKDGPPRHSTTSSEYSNEMNPRLKEALNNISTPTSSLSFTDFFAGYGDRNNSIGGESTLEDRPGSLCSQDSTAMVSNPRTSGESRIISMVAQDDISPIQQVNLRVGSMTVSKWLTFGHVLFSPAREDIMQLDSPKHHSILVIDGLGNDDWSFYAAETYPNVTFYNLSPTRPLSSAQRTSSNSFPLTPENHRQVQYLNTLDKFPFPRDFFSTVVFRFPNACSEASYRNIIAESKRVLKPAGYLEMSILDLDMMNMGNRARRAVRGLKVKMQVADPNTSIASASDTVLRLVGKRGFHGVKSCKVGVPVASIVPAGEGSSQKNEELSLADMMKDESQAGDEGITRMVAKVGRWWYTRSYEMGVMPDGDFSRSIFTDPLLLDECEKWNTNFKLVVAYAQKPVVPRRRTASV